VIEACILCGGLGTRLRARVADRPKALAVVRGRAVIDHQLKWLYANGIRNITLAAGHLGEQLEDYARARRARGEKLTVVREETRLGSGGAIANAALRGSIGAELLLVVNGDTLLSFATEPLARQHIETRATVTMVVTEVQDAARFGLVDVAGNMIRGFVQAAGRHEPGIVNAGAYLVQTSIVRDLPASAFSAELQWFPQLAAERRLFAYLLPPTETFVDVGTVEAFDEINRTEA